MFLEVFIDSHRISGSVEVPSGYLISRLLNNETLRLEQVSISRISRPGEIVAMRDHATVKAASINLLVVQKSDAQRVLPLSDLQGTVGAFITMPNFEIQGQVVTRARKPNTGYLMSEHTSVYLDPLLNGTATCMSSGTVYTGYLFLLRKDHISMLSVNHDAVGMAELSLVA